MEIKTILEALEIMDKAKGGPKKPTLTPLVFFKVWKWFGKHCFFLFQL